MRKRLLMLGVFILAFVTSAFAMNGYFLNGLMNITSITSTTTAGTFVKLTGSEARQTDAVGNVYVAQAFELYELTNTYDLKIAWVSNPNAYITWKAVWGPFQTWMNPPDGGVYVALTFTPDPAVAINIGFDNKR